jgi:hypothetical protein
MMQTGRLHREGILAFWPLVPAIKNLRRKLDGAGKKQSRKQNLSSAFSVTDQLQILVKKSKCPSITGNNLLIVPFEIFPT